MKTKKTTKATTPEVSPEDLKESELTRAQAGLEKYLARRMTATSPQESEDATFWVTHYQRIIRELEQK